MAAKKTSKKTSKKPAKAPSKRRTSRTAPRARTKAAKASATRRRRQKQQTDWGPAFLEAFAATGLITQACEFAGVGRRTVYDRRDSDEAFAAAWEEIEEETIETMERELYRRAVEGVEEPLVSAGKLVTTVTRYSDSLLQFALKAKRPATYRERVDVQHSGRFTGKVEFVAPDADEKRQGVARILDEVGALGNGNGNGHGS